MQYYFCNAFSIAQQGVKFPNFHTLSRYSIDVAVAVVPQASIFVIATYIQQNNSGEDCYQISFSLFVFFCKNPFFPIGMGPLCLNGCGAVLTAPVFLTSQHSTASNLVCDKICFKLTFFTDESLSFCSTNAQCHFQFVSEYGQQPSLESLQPNPTPLFRYQTQSVLFEAPHKGM